MDKERVTGVRHGHQTDVKTAARRIERLIRAFNGGQAPRTVCEWRHVCALFGVETIPLGRCPSRVRACLVSEEGGEWTTFFNPRAHSRRQAADLCHELAASLAMGNDPALLHCLTGDSAPGSAQAGALEHAVARRVTRRFFGRKRAP